MQFNLISFEYGDWGLGPIPNPLPCPKIFFFIILIIIYYFNPNHPLRHHHYPHHAYINYFFCF